MRQEQQQEALERGRWVEVKRSNAVVQGKERHTNSTRALAIVEHNYIGWVERD